MFFPFVLIAFGSIAFWAGNQLAPQTTADAALFRADPSCTRDLRTSQTGACTTVDAEILSARMVVSGTGKTGVRTPKVALRYADGSFHDAELDGAGASLFVYDVPSGARARAQTFRGTLVRVASGSDEAETVDAPDVNLETVSEMPRVGAFAIVFAVLLVVARVVYLRRRSANAPA